MMESTVCEESMVCIFKLFTACMINLTLISEGYSYR